MQHPEGSPNQESEPKTETHFPAPILKLLVVIVDEGRENKVINFLREHSVRLQYACAGKGTANSELLDLLGLDGSDKAVLFVLLPDFHAANILKTMPDQLNLEKNGHGIAFTMPLSGICNPVLQLFSEERLNKLAEFIDPQYGEKLKHLIQTHANAFKERMNHHMENESENINDGIVKHDLIIAVVNQGFSEDLMEAAKAAGAGGGTVVNARRTGLDDGSTFLGMPVQAQKDIIMLLIDRSHKMAVMKAINHSFGLGSEARGIIFSMPVDSVAGLHGAQ